MLEIHPSARKHGIADEDIEHAVDHAMSIDDREDNTRLYLGPARNAALLEVATIVHIDCSEIAIHAMKMRPKYRQLLPGE
jgi:GNAT superfamily N-acetyltransferase